MNLGKFKFWDHKNSSNTTGAIDSNNTNQTKERSGGNVYAFNSYIDSAPQARNDGLDDKWLIEASKKRDNFPKGLLAEESLQKFFNNNYFGLGQHNGLNFQSGEAEELGIASIISKFLNVLDALIDKRRARISQITHSAIQVNGQSSVVGQQLENLKNELTREIQLLETQTKLASEKKGWIVQALNLYQLGFSKGIREAVDVQVFFN